MIKPQFFKNLLTKEHHNFLLWIPIIFVCGCLFYLNFSEQFLTNFQPFLIFFGLSFLLFLFKKRSLGGIFFVIILIFLSGSFYSFFYENYFINYKKIEQKIYVEGIGKISAIKNFHNSINNKEGLSLLIEKPILIKSDFENNKKQNQKKIHKKSKKKNKNHHKKKTNHNKKSCKELQKIDFADNQEINTNSQNSSNESDLKIDKKKSCKKKSKKPRKPKRSKKENLDLEKSENQNLFDDTQSSSIEATQSKIKSDKKSSPNGHKSKRKKSDKKTKANKKSKISEKKILKEFLNIDDYQEVDREFLDYKKNVNFNDWQRISNNDLKDLVRSNYHDSLFPSQKNIEEQIQKDVSFFSKNSSKYFDLFPNPPPFISLSTNKNSSSLAVNDKIHFRALLAGPKNKEFANDFDFIRDAKMKKIGGFGFAIGSVEIVEKAQINNFDEWFLELREKIRDKIKNSLKGDVAGISIALLIGDQNEVSKSTLERVRHSGLAHLLSISGFHLSLASAIFFISIRFLLSRNESLTLHHNIKKISVVIAIIASYFYLRIANSPVPAQRAFLMVLAVMISILIDRKFHRKRALLLVFFLITLSNPYLLFSVSFQLSFVSVLMLIVYYEDLRKFLVKDAELNLETKFITDFLSKSKQYFYEIILLSILIQIITLPFLMNSFRNVAPIGFVANLIAIPLASFFIMPVGFLSLFLMLISCEKFALKIMGFGIEILIEISNFIGGLKISQFQAPNLPALGFSFAVFGMLFFCLTKTKFLKIFSTIIFIISFFTIFFVKKPDLVFEQNQKFYATYSDENGLFFSKKIRNSKQKFLWLQKFSEKEFKIIDSCKESFESNEFSCQKCFESFCEVKYLNKRILVLTKRNKISQICDQDFNKSFDVIVNMTAKYQLPQCIRNLSTSKLVIDNFDFLKHGTHFLFFEKDKIKLSKMF